MRHDKGSVLDERPQRLNIRLVVLRLAVWRLQDESAVRELRVTGYTPQRVVTDMTLADVPVAINSGVVAGPRIVEMDGAHSFCTHFPIKRLDRVFQSLCRAYIVTIC